MRVGSVPRIGLGRTLSAVLRHLDGVIRRGPKQRWIINSREWRRRGIGVWSVHEY